MSEILYILRSIIPNFEELIGTVGTVILLFGLVNAFFGYKWFKFVLQVMGFIFGAIVGYLVFLNSGNSIADSNMALAYVVIGGFIGAGLAEFFHGLGVFLSVGTMGAIIFFLMTQNEDAVLVIGIICGIVGVFLEKYCIIITTSLSGGYLAATGIWLRAIAKGDDPNVQVVGWLIGILGFLFQLWCEWRNPREAETGTSNENITDTAGVTFNPVGNVQETAPFQGVGVSNLEKQQSDLAGVQTDNANPDHADKMIFCANCGKMIKANANFCGFCGKKTGSA